MNWTTTPPVKVGWYWAWYIGSLDREAKPERVYIAEDNYCHAEVGDLCVDGGDCEDLPVSTLKAWWYGPLNRPALPVEVIQMIEEKEAVQREKDRMWKPSPLILFVRAAQGKIDYISYSFVGVTYTPTLEDDGLYHSPAGNFNIYVSESDEITATMDTFLLDEESRVNDLHRFFFRHRYRSKAIIDPPALSVAVSDGMNVGERLA